MEIVTKMGTGVASGKDRQCDLLGALDIGTYFTVLVMLSLSNLNKSQRKIMNDQHELQMKAPMLTAARKSGQFCLLS